MDAAYLDVQCECAAKGLLTCSQCQQVPALLGGVSVGSTSALAVEHIEGQLEHPCTRPAVTIETGEAFGLHRLSARQPGLVPAYGGILTQARSE